MQVKVVDWMKGQTCGLCGKADGEVRQEYLTPNGRLTQDPVSYAHSWVLPAESCRDTTGETQSPLWNLFYSNICFPINVQQPSNLHLYHTECRVRLESVRLEKQINSHSQESRCFSVEPVLRCLPGCFPVKTTTVTVGFHCKPAGGSDSNHR